MFSSSSKLINILVLILCMGTSAYAEDSSLKLCENSFVKGNDFYNEKEFEKAIDAYQFCIANSLESSELYYNLANTYYRNQEIGEAILYYEKALLLAPFDKDILHNLKMTRLQTKDKVAEEVENPMLDVIYGIYNFLGFNVGLWILSTLSVIGASILAVRMFYRGERAYLFYPLYALILMLALLISCSVGYRIYDYEVNSYGIVLSKNTDVMSGPGDSFQVLNELNEGTKLQITEENGDWYNIKLGESISGFVSKDDVSQIH